MRGRNGLSRFGKREPAALAEILSQNARALAQEQVLQFAFALQWDNVRAAAAKREIRILGDIAIFVSMDSADVWAHPEIFELDEDLSPIRVAGVPPDYFSATGQRWGNPLYRWDVLAETRFDWWVQRISRARQVYDIIRLDHFRGFQAYWAIPAEEETAINGEWIVAPGLELFGALEKALGPLPLVAEDLGLITQRSGLAAAASWFSRDARDAVRIQRQGRAHSSAAPLHAGTRGLHWHARQRHNARLVGTGRRCGATGGRGVPGPDSSKRRMSSPVWPLIRAVESSVAQLAIVPVQDLLEFGSACAHEYAGGAAGQLELARAGGRMEWQSWRRGWQRWSR